jgi:menaquinone-specific isochorismate synthase
MTVASAQHTGLRAVTRVVDERGDLVEHLASDGFAWIQDGIGFVTAGVAAVVEPRSAAAFLAAIEHDDEVGTAGTGPLAVGALPFDLTESHPLVVPQRIVGCLPDGRSWVTQLAPSVPEGPDRTEAPRSFTVEARTTHDEWCDIVRRALEVIERSELEKVVLARRVDVTTDRPIDVRRIVARLLDEQPGCFVYASDGLVGATPELLVRRRGVAVESRPMAGTVVGYGDDALARLHDSEKDARVHRPVPQAIAAALAPSCTMLVIPEQPCVVQFASVGHLVTPIEGRLSDPAPDAYTLAAALHPTPAVGGMPRDVALQTIAVLEPHPRGRYAGPVGWIDARGDGEWGVALRGAVMEGERATLHAGAGIVAGSIAENEWRETEAKLEPMLRALGVRDTSSPSARPT